VISFSLASGHVSFRFLLDAHLEAMLAYPGELLTLSCQVPAYTRARATEILRVDIPLAGDQARASATMPGPVTTSRRSFQVLLDAISKGDGFS